MFVQHGTIQKQLNLINSAKTEWSSGAVNQLIAESISQLASMLHAALLSLVTKAASCIDASWLVDSAVNWFTAPLDHTVLTLLMRLSCFWVVPCCTNMLVKSPSHVHHLLLRAFCRLASPI